MPADSAFDALVRIRGQIAGDLSEYLSGLTGDSNAAEGPRAAAAAVLTKLDHSACRLEDICLPVFLRRSEVREQLADTGGLLQWIRDNAYADSSANLHSVQAETAAAVVLALRKHHGVSSRLAKWLTRRLVSTRARMAPARPVWRRVLPRAASEAEPSVMRLWISGASPRNIDKRLKELARRFPVKVEAEPRRRTAGQHVAPRVHTASYFNVLVVFAMFVLGMTAIMSRYGSNPVLAPSPPRDPQAVARPETDDPTIPGHPPSSPPSQSAGQRSVQVPAKPDSLSETARTRAVAPIAPCSVFLETVREENKTLIVNAVGEELMKRDRMLTRDPTRAAFTVQLTVEEEIPEPLLAGALPIVTFAGSLNVQRNGAEDRSSFQVNANAPGFDLSLARIAAIQRFATVVADRIVGLKC